MQKSSDILVLWKGVKDVLQTHTHTEKHKYNTVFSTFTDELDNSCKLNSSTPIGKNDDRWLTEPETPVHYTNIRSCYSKQR